MQEKKKKFFSVERHLVYIRLKVAESKGRDMKRIGLFAVLMLVFVQYSVAEDTVIHKDGSVTVQDDEGTTAHVDKHGNVIAQDADGNTVMMDKDGNAIVENDDGIHVVDGETGDTVTVEE